MARNKVKVFFEKALAVSKKKIILVTMVLSDGIGDLGMLTFLYDKLISVGFDIVPIIFNDLPTSHSLIMKQIPNAEIITIDSNISAVSVASILNTYKSVNIKEAFIILYPFTFTFSLKALESSLGIHSDYLLGIKEMGTEFDINTGYLGNGIGFGIPNWIPTKAKKISYPQWFISCKSYLSSNGTKKDTIDAFIKRYQNFINLASSLCVTEILIIVSLEFKNAIRKLGNLEIIEDSEEQTIFVTLGIRVTVSLPMPTVILREYLDHTKQVIFSGGEALFVESLGANGNAAPILNPRYSFQCKEIANLLIGTESIEVVEKENPKRYQYFIDEKENLLFLGSNGFINIYDNLKSHPYKGEKLRSNAALQTIGFSLFATDFQLLPTLFYRNIMSAYQAALQLYSKLKQKLVLDNWFSLTEKKEG